MDAAREVATVHRESVLLSKPSALISSSDTLWVPTRRTKMIKGINTMRKTIAAVTAGLLLVAGQAAAANNSAVARVGDRVGANAEASSEFAGIPVLPLVLGIVALVSAISVATDDSSESN
jgi:hypothetical protein